MSIKTFKPTTPSRRQMTVSGFDGIDKKARPEPSLTEPLKKSAGRPGMTKTWKKAYVQLSADSKTIELFEGMV